MLERKQYAKPPLVEVFCRFEFLPTSTNDWDPADAGAFRQKLGQERFPAARSVHPMRGRRRLPADRLQFRAENESTTVQVERDAVVVSQLPPYYGWEQFEDLVGRSLSAYFDVWKVDRIVDMGLHYLDRIDVPGETVVVRDYFRLFPVLPESLAAKPIGRLAMSFDVQGDAAGDVLSARFHQEAPVAPSTTSFHLQWSYTSNTSRTADVSAALQWLRMAHDFASEAFRSTVTERCESLFNGDGLQHVDD